MNELKWLKELDLIQIFVLYSTFLFVLLFLPSFLSLGISFPAHFYYFFTFCPFLSHFFISGMGSCSFSIFNDSKNRQAFHAGRFSLGRRITIFVNLSSKKCKDGLVVCQIVAVLSRKLLPFYVIQYVWFQFKPKICRLLRNMWVGHRNRTGTGPTFR